MTYRQTPLGIDKEKNKYVYIIERTESFMDNPFMIRRVVKVYSTMEGAEKEAQRMKKEINRNDVNFLVWPMRLYK